MFGMSATQFVGATNTLTVAGSSNKQVGLIDSTVVGQMKVEMISPMGEMAVLTEATVRRMENNKIVDSTPKASITIDGDTITIKAKTIEILADATVKIVGKPIDLNP